MVLVAKRAIRDHWGDWDENFVPAPPFNVSEYQKRLNDICGLSRGEPIMKLEWGGDAVVTQYTEWDENGVAIKSADRPKFAIPRTSEVLGHRIYIPVRRWIICERNEPEQHRPWDNSDNTFTNEYGKNCMAADKQHPGHLYTPYIYVGDHSKCPKTCCSERICLGDYKDPDGAELNYLLECTYKLKKDFTGDPYGTLTDAQKDQIHRDIEYQNKKRLEAEETAFNEESKELWKTHKHAFEDYNYKKPVYIYKDGKPVNI